MSYLDPSVGHLTNSRQSLGPGGLTVPQSKVDWGVRSLLLTEVCVDRCRSSSRDSTRTTYVPIMSGV